MAKRGVPAKAGPGAPAPGVDSLYDGIRSVLENARTTAYRAVNFAMVQAYWQIGRLILEHEQGGRKRAAYGEAVLEELSRRLTTEFGRGYTVSNLRYMRRFHEAFPARRVDQEFAGGEIQHALRAESRSEPQIQHAVRAESEQAEAGHREIHHAARGESDQTPIRYAKRTESSEPEIRHAVRDESAPVMLPVLRPELSWTHYRLLLGVPDPTAREWYMNEAAEQHWSTRQLERQQEVLRERRLVEARRESTSTP